MFSELFQEISDTFDELRIGEPTRTLTVAKPFCGPARHIVTGALQPYGVKILDYQEKVRTAGVRGMIRQMGLSDESFDGDMKVPLPMAQVAKVEVSAKAAAWAEYLLLRTGKLYVVGDYQNPRNEAWARKHGGVMPTAWHDNKPMIETGCTKGMEAWAPLRKAAKGSKRK